MRFLYLHLFCTFLLCHLLWFYHFVDKIWIFFNNSPCSWSTLSSILSTLAINVTKDLTVLNTWNLNNWLLFYYYFCKINVQPETCCPIFFSILVSSFTGSWFNWPSRSKSVTDFSCWFFWFHEFKDCII